MYFLTYYLFYVSGAIKNVNKQTNYTCNPHQKTPQTRHILNYRPQ